MKKTLWLKRAAVLAMLISSLTLTGCGVKVWPSPIKSQDTFKFAAVNGTRNGGCLTVNINVSGKYQNVESLSLQFQAEGDGPGEGCPTCPFFPANRVSFTPGSDNVNSDENILTISECGLDPMKSYRWRVIGQNVYDTLGIIISDVFTAAP